MATSGQIQGRLVTVLVNSTALDDQMDSEISIELELDDATTKLSTNQWREFLPSYKSATGSCQGNISWDATEGVSEAFSDITTPTLITVLFSTEVSGDTTYAASAYMTNWTLSFPTSGMATYSYSYQLTGAITEGSVA